MRLIDADAAKKAVHEELDECLVWDESGEYTANVIEKILEALPAIDAVPVIRCRDCIYWKRYCRIVDGVTSNHVCGRKRELDGLMHRSKADDFCSWAKRRNDETD